MNTSKLAPVFRVLRLHRIEIAAVHCVATTEGGEDFLDILIKEVTETLPLIHIRDDGGDRLHRQEFLWLVLDLKVSLIWLCQSKRPQQLPLGRIIAAYQWVQPLNADQLRDEWHPRPVCAPLRDGSRCFRRANSQSTGKNEE